MQSRPETLQPEQWTYLSANYGAVRINGHDISGMSWSPDSTKIGVLGDGTVWCYIERLMRDKPGFMYWTSKLAKLRSYCGYGTEEHTPNPPKLVWSPDSTHLAFAGNIPGDDKGYLLLAMDIETGNMTEFSDGVYPNYGAPDVIAWGRNP